MHFPSAFHLPGDSAQVSDDWLCYLTGLGLAVQSWCSQTHTNMEGAACASTSLISVLTHSTQFSDEVCAAMNFDLDLMKVKILLEAMAWAATVALILANVDTHCTLRW